MVSKAPAPPRSCVELHRHPPAVASLVVSECAVLDDLTQVGAVGRVLLSRRRGSRRAFRSERDGDRASGRGRCGPVEDLFGSPLVLFLRISGCGASNAMNKIANNILIFINDSLFRIWKPRNAYKIFAWAVKSFVLQSIEEKRLRAQSRLPLIECRLFNASLFLRVDAL